MPSLRRLAAFCGPTLAGTAIGFYGSADYGPVVLGLVVGAGVGLTLSAFVPGDEPRDGRRHEWVLLLAPHTTGRHARGRDERIRQQENPAACSSSPAPPAGWLDHSERSRLGLPDRPRQRCLRSRVPRPVSAGRAGAGAGRKFRGVLDRVADDPARHDPGRWRPMPPGRSVRRARTSAPWTAGADAGCLASDTASGLRAVRVRYVTIRKCCWSYRRAEVLSPARRDWRVTVGI